MPPKWSFKHFDILESTQTALKELVTLGEAVDGLVVSCNQQSAGKGRHGNSWHSPKGNLYFTVLLRPKCTVNQAGHYSFIVGLALRDLVARISKSSYSIKLKWPNDLMVDGLKAAGILLESDMDHLGNVENLYIGIGINLEPNPLGRIGLNEISRTRIDRDLFLKQFFKTFGQYIDLYLKNGIQDILNDWSEQAYNIGKKGRARLQNESFEGVFEALDEDGALLLRLDNGTLKRITAGEVFF